MNKGKYLMAIALLLGAAGVPQLARAQTSTGLPQGFACGLSHYFNCGAQFQSACSAYGTFPTAPATVTFVNSCAINKNTMSGFVTLADGDGGLSAGYGFYHFSWAGPNSTPTTQYLLPKGTVCGLKEAKFDPSETCLGYDSNISCPPGWTQKFRNDSGAPSGGRFVWCEYQDPNNLCTASSCYYTNQPTGTVCGASDTLKVYPGNITGGQCMGLSPSTTNCASLGYQYFARDDSAPSGSGLGFCVK
jgi:hypothetical protein